MPDPSCDAPPASGPRWNPADYHLHSSEQQKWARELIAKLRLRPDEHVLDLGCGDGKVTAELASAVPAGRVVGIDSSEDMIRFARARIHQTTHANLTFELMDARRLTFQDEFDVAFSNAALHWIIDHRPVMAGIARALKPGGRILLQMGGKGNAAEVMDTVDEVMRRPAWRSCFDGFELPYGFHGPQEYRGWLLESGLVPARIELFAKEMVHEGPEGLASWFRTTWMPYTDRVPPALRGDFVQQVVESYLARRPADASGAVRLAMVRLEVEARRP